MWSDHIPNDYMGFQKDRRICFPISASFAVKDSSNAGPDLCPDGATLEKLFG